MKIINKLKPFLFSVFLFSVLATIYTQISLATNQTITCDEGSGCTGVAGPLFNESNLYPTQTITQTITANNNYADNRDFAVAISSSNFSDSTPSMADMLSIGVVEQESGLTVYSASTISQWKSEGFIVLSNIPSGATRHYIFTVTFADVGNEYQGKNLSFDLNLGFDALPPSSTLSTTTVSCDNRNFDAIMTLKNDGVVVSGVNVEFAYHGTTVTRTTNSSGIAQAGFTQSGEYSVTATPQSGGYPSHSIFISAPTGCDGGVGGGTVLGVTTFGQPSAQTGSVQGLSDEEDQQEEVEGLEGSIEGVTDCEETIPWWVPLLIQLLVTIAYYIFISHSEGNSFIKILLLPAIFGILSQIAHSFLGCGCSASYWCERYLVINLVIFSLTYLIHQIRYTLSNK
ncbi:hypothetical protein ACFL1M_02380 [Patescibacteria group bacterium]